MVLVFSAGSNASQHIIREVELAAQHRMPVIPLRVENVQPCPTLDYYIAGTHWLDAIDPPLEAHLERLTSVIRRLLDGEGPAAADAASGVRIGTTPAGLLAGTTSPGARAVLAPLAPPAPVADVRAPALPPIPTPPPGRGRRRGLVIGAAIAALAVLASLLAIWLPGRGGAGEPASTTEASPSASVAAPSGPAAVAAPSPSASAAMPRVGAPTDLRLAQVTPYEVTLIWTRARAGGRVDYFRVLRDGEPVGARLDERTFVDEEVVPGREYRYRVVAVGVDGSRAGTAVLLVNVPAVPPPSGGSPPSSSEGSPPACDGIVTPSGECIPWS
jgi:hypothetical protein